MIAVAPLTLQGAHVRLEPLAPAHADALAAAAADGTLWTLRVTSVPAPADTAAYVAAALAGQQAGHMLPFVVRRLADDRIVGTTRYHDIVAALDRVEIGFTWYARSAQRTTVNLESKRLLLAHAFEALRCAVVAFRTDNFNLASQRAIEALGARRDGVLRHHAPRRDGTVRDTVVYSITAGEWPEVRAQLDDRLRRRAEPAC